MSTPLAAIAAWYETLSPKTLGEIDNYYLPEVYFEDPFQSFNDRDGLEAVYRRMFEKLEQPRFTIDAQLDDHGQGVLIWRFEFGWRGRDHCIRGCSHLQFDADGRVSCHRDYWDAAEHVYEHIPVLGAVLRFIKKRVG
jgi:steroid Delta-isomerase